MATKVSINRYIKVLHALFFLTLCMHYAKPQMKQYHLVTINTFITNLLRLKKKENCSRKEAMKSTHLLCPIKKLKIQD